MTRLAAKQSPIGAFALHAVVEFTVMRIDVASGTSAVLEMERQNLVGTIRCAHLMAFAARYGHMCSRQRKFRLSMLGDGEERAVEVRYGMAILATIPIKSGGKLSVVSVLVAIHAVREFNFVNGVLASGQMALGTLHSYVLAFQGVLRGGMFFYAKERRLPAIHGMAFGAFAFLRPCVELSAVRVWFVTVHAVFERNWLLEISTEMARGTADHRMLPEQRILGLRMIKLECGEKLFPPRCRMALLASLLE